MSSAGATVDAWVSHVAKHTHPRRVQWWYGTAAETSALVRELLDGGRLVELDARTHARGYLHRGRSSESTAINHLVSSATGNGGARSTQTFMSRASATKELWPLFQDAMRDKVLYVVPYVLGPLESPLADVGVQLTDDPLLVLALQRMARIGASAEALLRRSPDFARSLHTARLGELDCAVGCHFPEHGAIWSVGIDAGSFLRQQSHGLRLATFRGCRKGWVATRMAIVGVTTPKGSTHYVGGVFSPSSGRSHFSMLRGRLPGWKISTFATEAAWIRLGEDGRLWAINPYVGTHVRLRGHTHATSPSLMTALRSDTLFNNVAVTHDGQPWWEGQDGTPFLDHAGTAWTPDGGRPASPPGAYAVVPLDKLGEASPALEESAGIPLDAVVFGTRRGDTVPLITETEGWQSGCYLGATLLHEPVERAGLSSDPMAMRSYCATEVSEYLTTWLHLGHEARRPPKVYLANWFRRGEDDSLLWPGFGENARVLEWIVNRLDGTAAGTATPIGAVPTEESLDWNSLGLSVAVRRQLRRVDGSEWRAEVARHAQILADLAKGLPFELRREHTLLGNRIVMQRTEHTPRGSE